MQFNPTLLWIPGALIGAVAVVYPRIKAKNETESSAQPQLVTSFAEGVGASYGSELHQSNDVAVSQTSPLDLDNTVREVMGDLGALMHHVEAETASEISEPAASPSSEVSDFWATIAQQEPAAPVAPLPFTLEESADTASLHVEPVVESTVSSLGHQTEDEYDEERDDVPAAEESGQFVPAWRADAEPPEDDEEPVYFGQAPLTPEQREAARQRWEAANAPLAALPTLSTEEHRPSVPVWETSDDHQHVPAAETSATTHILSDDLTGWLTEAVLNGISAEDAARQLIASKSADAETQLLDTYNASPEYRESLLRALNGNTSETAATLFMRAIRENSRAGEVWAALTGLDRIRTSNDDYRDLIEGALTGEPAVAAKAVRMLLGDASHDDYARYLEAHVNADQASAVLSLLDPILAA